jgi:hemolysin activation/secretion protein
MTAIVCGTSASAYGQAVLPRAPAGLGDQSSQPLTGSPLPRIQPPPATEVAPPPAAPNQAVPEEVPAGQTYAIGDVTITGVTAFPEATIEHYQAGLTGNAVTLERIAAARSGIVSLYRRAGYSYTTARARISGGHLRITVVEPHVVAVKLSQDIGPAGTLVLGFLNHLADGRLLKEFDLERFVLLANDIPGVTVRVLLDPSATDPGALTVRAQVERQPVNASLRADNRAFRLTGPEELLADGSFNSFTALGDKTEVSLYHTFNNTDTFGQMSEDVFIGTSGLRMHVYGGAGESIPSGTLREIGYDGVTRVFGAALSYPVIRSRAHSLSLALQFDGVESDVNYDVLGRSSRASFDSLRILRLDGIDTLSDIWLGPAFVATDTAELTLSQGLPGFGASANGNRQLPRLNERVDFTKGSARLERLQTLFHPFTMDGQRAEVNLNIAAAGQYTGNILPPEEKFYLGGPDFDRGFYYGQVTGDKALTARFQPQLVTALPALPRLQIVPQATFYGFYDWGETWENQRQDLPHTLRSLGGGVKLLLGAHAEIDLEGVSRLTRTPDGGPPAGQRIKASAFYWQVAVHF